MTKLQYDINRKIAKISALSSDKYECLTGEEILLPHQHRIIQALNLCIPHLGRHLKNKNYWGAEKKQVKVLQFLDLVGKTELKWPEDIFLPQNQLNNLVTGRLKEIAEIQSSG